MAFSLLPQENRFFDLFDKQGASVLKAARFFKEISSSGMFDDVNVLKMHDIEHECDEITYDIIGLLNKTFITPFDREDIHKLAHQVDDIVDMTYSIIKKINLYKISAVNNDLIQFADYIEQSAVAIESALKGLRKSKNVKCIMDDCSKVYSLESQGDLLKDAIIGKLLDNNPDPITFIKWKEIYETAETILDVFKDVTKVIGSILVKQG